MSCPEDCLPPWVFLSNLKSSCVGSSLVGGLFFAFGKGTDIYYKSPIIFLLNSRHTHLPFTSTKRQLIQNELKEINEIINPDWHGKFSSILALSILRFIT